MKTSLDSLSRTRSDPAPVRRMPSWVIPLLIIAGFAVLFLGLFRDRLLPIKATSLVDGVVETVNVLEGQAVK